jgi:hypothetical protein
MTSKRLGLPGQIMPEIYERRLKACGLIEEKNGRLTLTPKGWGLPEREYTQT